jgi:uncharacterized membrane protein YjjB (DUF3815 family)
MSHRFESPALLWWILIPTAILYLILLAHWPSVLPFAYLGTLGELSQYLVSNYRILLVTVVWATIIAHVYEAFVARGICRKLNIDRMSTLLWVVQTFILGLFSFCSI